MFTIGIIGRTNVGKSSLFNALIRKKRVIVSNVPNTTRDKIIEELFWKNSVFKIVDTRGIDEEDKELFLDTIEDFDLCLFVIDSSAVLPLDFWISKKLKESGKKVVVVGNKIDLSADSTLHMEFGFKDFISVSSTSFTNISELRDICASFCDNLSHEETFFDRNTITITIIGRPNTGKSTLMNTLCGKIVSKVDNVPLTTRDPIKYRVKLKYGNFAIIDTAGIRKHIVSHIEKEALYLTKKMIDMASVVFFILKIEDGITRDDERLLELLKDKFKKTIILLNFWDKLKTDGKLLLKNLPAAISKYEILPISALTGYGVKKCLLLAKKLHEKERIATNELNKALIKLQKISPPPLVKNRPFKIKYATQTSSEPLEFILFTNSNIKVPRTYHRFVENFLRKEFNLLGAPVKIVYRQG